MLLDTLLQQKVALMLAKQSGLEQDPVYKARVENVKKLLSQQPDAGQGVLRQDKDAELMESLLLMSYRSRIPVADKELKDYYNQRIRFYQTAGAKSRRPARSFVQVKEEIRNQLQAEQLVKMCHQALSALKIDVDEKTLNSLDLSPSAATSSHS